MLIWANCGLGVFFCIPRTIVDFNGRVADGSCLMCSTGVSRDHATMNGMFSDVSVRNDGSTIQTREYIDEGLRDSFDQAADGTRADQRS